MKKAWFIAKTAISCTIPWIVFVVIGLHFGWHRETVIAASSSTSWAMAFVYAWLASR